MTRTGAAVRGARDLRSAAALVLRDVADAAGWRAGHAWRPGDEPGTWTSLGLWHPDDGIALGGLRAACFAAPPAPARGHLALALASGDVSWTPALTGLAHRDVHDAAVAAGVVAAVACAVRAGGEPVALLEWYLADAAAPPAAALDAVRSLAGALGATAGVHGVPEQGRNAVAASGAGR